MIDDPLASKNPMLLPEPFIGFWADTLKTHGYYQKKIGISSSDINYDWFESNFRNIPFTTKEELTLDQETHPPYGNFHFLSKENYQRTHQTSGTTGKPIFVLDTKTGWSWMSNNWQTIFNSIGITGKSRLFFAFSFGPFLGFWTAFEAANLAGHFCVPGGAMSTSGRLESIRKHEIQGVFCTPSYALRLGEESLASGKPLKNSGIRWLVLAGEPGAQIPSTRAKIESLWGDIVVDHHGMTETGPVSYECPLSKGTLHILSDSFVAESFQPNNNLSCMEGELGELVLSNWGRAGSSILRYRTGDLVKLSRQTCKCGFEGSSLLGGILGRVDDMIFYKGNNIFPSAIQNLVHQFPEITEYQVWHSESLRNPKFQIRIEVSFGKPEETKFELENLIQKQLLFKPEIIVVEPNHLPRVEMKGKRFHKLSQEL